VQASALHSCKILSTAQTAVTVFAAAAAAAQKGHTSGGLLPTAVKYQRNHQLMLTAASVHQDKYQPLCNTAMTLRRCQQLQHGSSHLNKG
jgi:uncharacterized membrane protein YgdD (TMEM256/DUF423 family)